MAEDPVEFSWDGRTLQGLRGEPVAAALWRAGILVQTRGIKYHRPRGPRCFSGGCSGCMVRIDGVPNKLGCQAPLEAGAQVESQVGIPTAGRDLLGVVDRLLPHFDHERDFVRPAPVRAVYEAVARRLAGFGAPPTRSPEYAAGQVLSTDVLVVGGGPAGLGAAWQAASQGAEVLLVDLQELGGSLLHTPGPVDGGDLGVSPGPELASALQETLPERVTVTRGSVLGLYEEREAVVLDVGEQAPRVHRVHAGAIVLANGAHEGPVLVPGNDLPGVLGARAGRILLNRLGVPPGDPLAVLTAGRQGRALAREARSRGLDVLELDAVDRIGGSGQVEWAQVRGEQLACQAVALDAGLEPAVELVQQAGVPLAYRRALGGRVPLHRADGATPVPTVHVAGSCAGLHDPAGALLQGRAAGARAAGANPPSGSEALLARAGLEPIEAKALEALWRGDR